MVKFKQTYLTKGLGGFMVSLIVGLLLCGFTVFSLLPTGLAWSDEIIFFLKGFAPTLAAFVGLIAIFIGVADLKDKSEAKKEESLSKNND